MTATLRDSQDWPSLWRSYAERARIDGRRAWLAVFDQPERWEAAPDWVQSEANEALLEQLGANFSSKAPLSSTSAERRRVVLRVLHRPTEVTLHLVLGRRTSSPTIEARFEPFLIGATPLTQAQWDRIGGEDDRRWSDPNRPIERVTWFAARDWTRRAGDGLRLPSESEWETAAFCGQSQGSLSRRGAKEIKFGWFSENSQGMTHPVGEMEPNELGLYDLFGNVWEWCQDYWLADGAEDVLDEQDPLVERDESNERGRICRGGCWYVSVNQDQGRYRGWRRPQTSAENIGFRPCRSLRV